MSKSMADRSNILTNGVIFSTLKHTDPHAVRGRSIQIDGVCFLEANAWDEVGETQSICRLPQNVSHVVM